jgi:hypothetical protein
MTVSASDHAHDDLLGTEAPERGRFRPSRSVLLAAGAAAVLSVGALSVQVAQSHDSEPAAPEDLSGSLLIVDGSSTTATLPFGDHQERNGHGTGSVQLELPGRKLEGVARMDWSASFDGDSDTVPASFSHYWGDIRLDFDSTTCRGSLAWSYFDSPAEGGGSLHARCEDGATLAAELATPRGPARDGIGVDLHDGWYVAGSPDGAEPDPRPGTLPQSGD